jgi:hypothetical protein
MIADVWRLRAVLAACAETAMNTRRFALAWSYTREELRDFCNRLYELTITKKTHTSKVPSAAKAEQRGAPADETRIVANRDLCA